ncbi:MAG: hypothetical protein HRT89_19075 [Lentisphaeria bacterium]|nr:hypothetical protein [Lentisphaeria bacterium]NQZ70161.1 hypothetical protein [Lentisphaeria bacterium]
MTRGLIGLALVVVLQGCSKSDQTKTIEIDPSELQLAPIQHEQLSEEQLRRIQKIYKALDGIDGQSIDSWIEDFKRDLDPNPNILIWEQIAEAYTNYLSQKELSPQQKYDAYLILLIRSMVPNDDVMPRVKEKLKALTEKDVKDVLSFYRWNAEPITVIKTTNKVEQKPRSDADKPRRSD